VLPSAVRLSLRQLNRATLARQLLLERASLPPAEAVRRVVALQAQEPASPYLALWSRLRDFDAGALDAAFRSYEVVKAPLMRITLHAVASEDHAPFRQAMRSTLRDARLNDARFRSTGLSIADADALVPHVVASARRPRRRDEVEGLLAELLGSAPQPGVWWALRTVAPLVHAPSGGPWSFGRSPSYVAPPQALEPGDRGAAIRRLLRRYLEAFGPASRRDFAQFALLRQADLRPAFEALADELQTVLCPDGSTLYDVAGAPLPDGDAPAPARLLAMWDSVLLAHHDRSRVIPPPYREHVIRRNGDVLPTVLVDGFVSGVWRPVDGGIEVTAFSALPDDAWQGIEREARALLTWLGGRDGAVYGRYAHWWSRLPAAQVHVVSAATET
jgi:hypothetical protein